jgi:hypothetical protein
MNLFNEEDFGKTISTDLSNYIKINTSRTDFGIASEKSGVGTSTIRDVVYGYNTLTKSNSKGIEQLLIIARDNFNSKIKASKKVNEFLKKHLAA